MTGTRARRRFAMLLLIISPMVVVGCTPWSPGFYPFSMGLATPIPVAPWVTERMEEKYNHQNDFRTAILPPIIPGSEPPTCEDPPDDAMILRAWQKVARGVPYFYEEFRDEISIVKTLLVDKIDPPLV